MNRAAVSLLALALAGCAVGPDYRRPALAPAGYAVPETGPGAPEIVAGQDPRPAWWEDFGSTALNALVVKARAQSLSLAAAKARLKAAKEDLRAQQGAFWPAVSVGAARSIGTYDTAPGAPGAYYSVGTQSANVAFSPDVFGGHRRAVEGAAAWVDYERFERAAAEQALSADVVTTAIGISSLKAQIGAAHDLIAEKQVQLELMKGQWAAGTIGQADLVAARAQYDAQIASLDDLSRSLAVAQHRLAILLAQSPDQVVDLGFSLDDLTFPKALPVTLPSRLIERRPDVRASEALLRQASANIGVAEANQLPQFNITATSSSPIWSLTGAVVQPVFAGGALNAKRKSAIDAYNAAAADYRAAVLRAVQNVADALTALDSDTRTWAAARDRLAAATTTAALAEARFKAGTVSQISLSIARQTYQQARIDDLQATASRFADAAALNHALGGAPSPKLEPRR